MMKKVIVFLITALMLIALAGCETKQDTGTLAGGAVGAVLGSEVGGTTGTIVGALGGAFLGREIGKYMDNRDREQVASALETQGTGETRTWTNPDTGKRYQVTPTETFSEDGRPCRRFTMDVEGEREDVTGTACRTASGDWQIVS